jgi:hypothetical protein
MSMHNITENRNSRKKLDTRSGSRYSLIQLTNKSFGFLNDISSLLKVMANTINPLAANQSSAEEAPDQTEASPL